MKSLTTDDVYEWLEEVKDPEIPVLSLVDLGVISKVIIAGKHVKVVITPTFIGCPALEMMRDEIIQVLNKKAVEHPEVEISYHEPWSSDRISERGKQALKKFGLAPPAAGRVFTDLELLEQVSCPRCNGTDTILKSPFGSTLCRSIHFCNTCREGFEQFKPL